MEEHVGVKAPGSAKRTTLFPLNKSLDVTSFQVNGLDPPILSSRTLALKTTSGTESPSFADMVIAEDRILLNPNLLVIGEKAIDDEIIDNIIINIG